MKRNIGRYEILDQIGEGAMAKVYKAYDPQIDRTLAFKVLKKVPGIDEDYVARFLREAKAAGAMSHPNIVTIYDVGEADDYPYIIMEMLEGTPLDQLMKPGVKLPIAQVLSIGIQLAQALQYAHDRAIVHRDVKPSNIIVAPDGKSITITDFGIAHIDDVEATQRTQAGAVLGTPQYMSPEQALGRKVDGRSDLFSVGVILYELVAGKKPFPAKSLAQLLLQIIKEEPQAMGAAAADIPVGLRHIVEKLLSKQPEARFQNGDDLANALSRELAAILEEEEETERHNFVPIRVKWALVMASIVALTMIVSIVFIYQKQYQVMTIQVVDSGASLAKFIATETAIPILGEDWVTIETFVQEASKRKTFDYLTVVDHKGVVRGASDQDLIGREYASPAGGVVIAESEGVRASAVALPDGKVFDFDTPILFQDKVVGRIHLGLPEDSLREVANTTLFLMVLLAIITIVSVVIVSYVVARLLARPIKTLRVSMSEVTTGNLDCRISQTRNDELGELFSAFNKMVASLQRRDEQDPSKTST